ncbi:hypothetical protein [Paenibacillus sp. RC21]|uniref:hypothetical protein n=1 Tax=Paenibacillus sp. RC21 TaxID=3156312 RepID=UPI00383562E2
MWPLGEYGRLVHEIKKRENTDIPITFGLLIADYRQQLSREYILNYINRFNYKSDKYINFYLPGYFQEDFYNNQQIIKIKDKKYYFNEEKYMDFLEKLEVDFDLEYTYNPRLILMEYERGNFNKSKKITIELDNRGADIKKTGELFEKIFDIAKKYVNVEDFSNTLMKQELKSGIFDRIIKTLDNQLLTEIKDSYNRVKKYKII